MSRSEVWLIRAMTFAFIDVVKIEEAKWAFANKTASSLLSSHIDMQTILPEIMKRITIVSVWPTLKASQMFPKKISSHAQMGYSKTESILCQTTWPKKQLEYSIQSDTERIHAMINT